MLQAMLRYRELQGVEQLFRLAGGEGVGAPSPTQPDEPKSLLATRPIFHRRDAAPHAPDTAAVPSELQC